MKAQALRAAVAPARRRCNVAGIILGAALAAASFVPNARAGGDLAPRPQSTNWSGFYAGIHLGGGWGDSEFIFPVFAASSSRPDLDGVVAGGQVGLNAQFGNFVVGVEVSLSSGPRGSAFANASEKETVDVSPLFQAVGRAGYTWGNTLVYGLGGYAGADVESFLLNVNNSNSIGDTKWHNGWVIGAGVEFMLHPNVIFGLEYRHVALDDAVHRGFNNFGGNVTVRNHLVDADFDIVQARLNIKFDHGRR